MSGRWIDWVPARHGQDKAKTGISKSADAASDLAAYKKALLAAGRDVAPYLMKWQNEQSLPSTLDIQGAMKRFAQLLASGKLDWNKLKQRARAINPKAFDRVNSSLRQEFIPGRYNTQDQAMTAMRYALGTDKRNFPLREVPEPLLRFAWPAVTNALEYGSAPVRPPEEQVILKKQ